MQKQIIYVLSGFLLFIAVYLCVGIIKMPALDMRDTLQKGELLLYRKFFLYPHHHDIIVYKSDYYPEGDSSESSRYFFIQRVVALPGDTLLIDSNKVFINHKLEPFIASVQKNYIIDLEDSIEKYPYLNTRIPEQVLISKKFEYAVSVSYTLYQQLKQDKHITGISYDLEYPSVYEEAIFPHSEHFHWNKHFFGPLYLPKKNDTLKLNKKNLLLYFPLIQKEEKSLFLQNDSLFINGQYTPIYLFKNDYYFVMGDNRDNAIDSRYLGPVKQDDIIGIVFYWSLKK